MRKWMITLMIIFQAALLYGQEEQMQYYSELFESRLSGELYYSNSSYSGSQLFQERWFPGDIILESGKIVHVNVIAYNGFEDELLWVNLDLNKMIKLDKGLVKGFVLRDSTNFSEMIFAKFPMKSIYEKDSVKIFVQILFSNKIKLYAHRRIVVGSVVDRNTKYSRYSLDYRPVYYMFLPGGEKISMIKIRKKHMLAVFPERKPEIRKKLRKNRIRVNNETGLVEAVKIIEELY
jgi:hypothetical protein